MSPTDAARVLTLAATFDNRKPDQDAAKAWALVLDGIRLQDAGDAVIAHYRATNEWLMPTHVIAAVRRIRSKRISEAGTLTPPPDLDPVETCAWLAVARARVGDGESPEDVSHAYALEDRNLPELRALIRRGLSKPPPAPLLAPGDLSREPEGAS